MSLICPLGGLLNNIYVSDIEQISLPAPDPIFITHNLVISNSFKGFTGLNSECIHIREYFQESCMMPWLPHFKTSALLVIFHPVLFLFSEFLFVYKIIAVISSLKEFSFNLKMASETFLSITKLVLSRIHSLTSV